MNNPYPILLMIRRIMPKGKAGSVAILDVISNSLCATLCLFVTASSISSNPLDARRRVEGKLIIDFQCFARSGLEVPLPILIAPKPPEGFFDPVLGNDLVDLSRPLLDSTMSSVDYYKHALSPFRYEMVITNPFRRAYYIGLLYTDHADFNCESVPVTVKVRSFFSNGLQKIPYQDTSFVLSFPSQVGMVELTPPVLEPL